MISRYCECGAGLRIVGADHDPCTAKVLAVWASVHGSAHLGHGECTAAEANAIRMAGRYRKTSTR